MFQAENIPTFVALPIEALQNNSSDKPENFQIIKNAIIKTLSDGTLCIVDASEPPQQLDGTPQNLQVIQPQNPTSSVYKCSKCSETFDKVALYRKHMMWHRNVKKYKCDKCLAGYNVETNLKIHMAMHNEGKPSCPICNITFQRLASLKSHLMLHQVEEMYTCEDCGGEFEKEEELNIHLQSHLSHSNQDSQSLVCSYCNVEFEDRTSFKEHVSHHVKIKKMVLSGKKSRKTNSNKNYPHVCTVCLKSFSKMSLLERHSRVHSGERPFICEFCNKGFNQKGTLQIHLSKHTGIKPFQCTLCGAKFNQKGNLRVHVEKTHTAPMPGVKMYKCPHCTCIFKKIASLNVHITKCHVDSEPVEDDITNVLNKLKVLEEQTTINSEKQSIEQNKKVLNDCKKGDCATSYVRLAESSLDGTIRRYLVMQKKMNDVKWYICSYCNKEFKKPSDLIRHTRVHTREKPFTCKQCGASFALKSTLFYHVKTHISNNNYSCAICAKKFTSSRSVHTHLRKHDKMPRYKCLSCNKCFPSMQKAKLHNKQYHGHTDKTTPFELKSPLVQTSNGLLPVLPQKPTPKLYSCPICSTKFSKMPNLKRHMMLHNGDKKFKCEWCQKCYSTAHALKEHSLYHTGVRNFCCKVCSKAFTTSSLLKRHLLTHSVNRPYICPYCNKSFKSVLMCKKHMNVHKKDTEISVQETNQQELYQIIANPEKDINQEQNQQVQTIFINCDDLQLSDNNLYPQTSDTLLFSSLNDLQNTNLTIDSINTEVKNDKPNLILNDIPYYSQADLNLLLNLDNEFATNNCDLNLSDINLNEVPILNLEQPPPPPPPPEPEPQSYTCNKCSKVFTNKKTYMKHVHTHNESKKPSSTLHSCSFCDKVFKKHSDLVRHIRTHTGEKPFACDKCEKKFSLKSTLISHQRTHNPVSHKPFSCVVCNSFFTSKSSLKVHMTVHTGDKAHKCAFCPMKFRTAAHRKSHENSYHINPSKKRKNKVTNLLASVAMDVLEPTNSNPSTNNPELDNVLIVQEPLTNDILNEPLMLQQLQSNFLLQDNLIPSSLIQLDDGTLLNVKTVTEDQQNDKPRNLECDICHKKYASKDVLRKHRKIHYKKFGCSKCEKGFDSEADLQTHEKTHEGIRPFSCLYCANSFSKEHSLATHMKRIHNLSLRDNVLLSI